MTRLGIIFSILVAASSFATAQIVADFETGVNGFAIGPSGDFGTALTVLKRVADPTTKSAGVLQTNWNFAGAAFNKGAILLKPSGGLAVHGARILTFWLYVPDSIPATFNIAIFAQDNIHFAFHSTNYPGSTLPRKKWFPLSIDLAQTTVKDSTFNLVTGNIFQAGIQIDNAASTSTAWAESLYIDNVALIGAAPVPIASFESGLEGFTDQAFGPALKTVKQVPDPTSKSSGVMQTSWIFPNDTLSKGAVGITPTGGLASGGAQFITYWVFLPDTTMPDSMTVGVFAQDNLHFSYQENPTLARDIPKKTWYPLTLDLAQAAVKDSTFDLVGGKVFKTGIQLQTYNYKGPFPRWADSMYTDNVAFLTYAVAPPPKKYVLADFNTIGDVGGFGKESFGPAATAVANGVDTTNAANRVLVVTYSFSDTGATKVDKGVISRDNISIWSASADTTATDIAIDVYIPPSMPDSFHLAVAYQGTATGNAFTQDDYFVAGPGTVQTGQWNTVKYSVAGHIANHSITNTRGTGKVYIQIFYPSVKNWSGKLFYDNLTLLGITSLTSVAQNITTPYEYRLYNNYPNPFNPTTNIRYELKVSGKVTLKVYDILGQEVETLVDEQQEAGGHTAVFDGKRLASGAYFYTLHTGSFLKTQKMMLIK